MKKLVATHVWRPEEQALSSHWKVWTSGTVRPLVLLLVAALDSS